MSRLLVPPLLSALIAAGAAFALLNMKHPYLPEVTVAEAVLAGAACFFLLLGLMNHLMTARLAARLGGRLSGLDSFDTDLRRRLGKLEATVAQIALNTASSHQAELRPGQPAPAPAEPPSGNAEDEANVIRFDREARARGQNPPQARLAGERLDNALEDDAIVAWFQPVVTLPGRKTRFFEASPFLAAGHEGEGAKARRLDPGYASDPEIDRRLLLQSLTLLRELDRAEKALGVIWHVHAPLLADPTAFVTVERILEANGSLCDQLICRIDHRDYAKLDQVQLDRLHRIAELGFRMALGNCPLPERNDAALASGLFPILMIDAARLVASRLDGGAPASRIGRSLARSEVEIVASGVENEEQAVALIDQDIMLAQGEFFSPPRPLRRSTSERYAAEN